MVLNLFFREIKSRGYQNIPKDGPVIFAVAPHSNQFVDPLILLQTCGRKVGFLAVNYGLYRQRNQWIDFGLECLLVHLIPV
jgi:glycerol-3-phosphate O-acyltransferase/dihydroxyacetone phosphate acyltransferase